MDFFTFIIIASFIYSIFAKRDKAPQRRPRGTEDNPIPPITQSPKPVTTAAKPAEMQGRKNIFENLERQIRETAERFEQELQGGKTVPTPTKPRTVKTVRPRPERTNENTRGAGGYQETEGSWGTEGRSDYDRYVSNQGTQGSEGAEGQEGRLGQEGTLGNEGAWGTEGAWGAEGGYYAQRQKAAGSAIEQGAIGVNTTYEPKKRIASIGFSGSEIMQGIIWAEVLKEPRGKRGLSRR